MHCLLDTAYAMEICTRPSGAQVPIRSTVSLCKEVRRFCASGGNQSPKPPHGAQLVASIEVELSAPWLCIMRSRNHRHCSHRLIKRNSASASSSQTGSVSNFSVHEPKVPIVFEA